MKYKCTANCPRCPHAVPHERTADCETECVQTCRPYVENEKCPYCDGSLTHSFQITFRTDYVSEDAECETKPYDPYRGMDVIHNKVCPSCLHILLQLLKSRRLHGPVTDKIKKLLIIDRESEERYVGS